MNSPSKVTFKNRSGTTVWLRVLMADSFSNSVLNANEEIEERVEIGYDRYCYSKVGPIGNKCDESIVDEELIELT